MYRKNLIKSIFLIIFLITNATTIQAADLKWQRMPIKVCLPPDSNSTYMKQAFQSWETALNQKVRFTYLTANSCPDAQITVSYAPNKKSSLTSYAYTGNYITKVHIEIGLLTKEGRKNSDKLLIALMQHEIGHAIGITGHTNTPNSIMQPIVKENYKITEDSIKQINNLYK